MTRPFPLRSALVALLALGTLGACVQTDQSPAGGSLAPTAPNADRQQASWGDERYGGGFDRDHAADPRTASQRTAATASAKSFATAVCADRKVASYSAVIGPGGGTLEFGDNRLIVPGGALRDTVTISATVLDATSSRVELQPHGLQFAKPAGLMLGTTTCTLSNPDYPVVVYLSPTGEILEVLQAVYDPHWHTLATPIDHFSGYAIAF